MHLAEILRGAFDGILAEAEELVIGQPLLSSGCVELTATGTPKGRDSLVALDRLTTVL